jgi:5-amino-6-(5-phosphoribosylamino)uracil reductase
LRLAIAPFFVADPSAPRFGLPAAYPQTPAHPMTLTSLRQVGEVAVHRYRLSP